MFLNFQKYWKLSANIIPSQICNYPILPREAYENSLTSKALPNFSEKVAWLTLGSSEFCGQKLTGRFNIRGITGPILQWWLLWSWLSVWSLYCLIDSSRNIVYQRNHAALQKNSAGPTGEVYIKTGVILPHRFIAAPACRKNQIVPSIPYLELPNCLTYNRLPAILISSKSVFLSITVKNYW